jgi:hypothetical protein
MQFEALKALFVVDGVEHLLRLLCLGQTQGEEKEKEGNEVSSSI